jgi:mannose-6-phosphate isomerase
MDSTDKSLYPLKFYPILKHRIWGGDRLKTVLGKNSGNEKIGESWELSGVPGDISVVKNGFLKDNNLQELIEVYMGDLVGDSIYERFGLEFPVLIKFIDAQDDLSIQVHPDDKLAGERHHSYGKTEMWYIMEAGADSKLIVGFNREMDRDRYVRAVDEGKLEDILNFVKVSKDDVFFIPAGRIHAIGKNILLAEIQQTSDITYRIYDWNRVDSGGNPRELHTGLAVDAIDYALPPDCKTRYEQVRQGTAGLVKCPYFTTAKIRFDRELEKDYQNLDSFVIYICTSGACTVHYAQGHTEISKGETLLIPAVLKNIHLVPSMPTELLEVYIETETAETPKKEPESENEDKFGMHRFFRN